MLEAYKRAGSSFDSEFLQAAAHSAASDCLEFVHQSCGLPLPADTCLTACRAGSVACLRYLLSSRVLQQALFESVNHTDPVHSDRVAGTRSSASDAVVPKS